MTPYSRLVGQPSMISAEVWCCDCFYAAELLYEWAQDHVILIEELLGTLQVEGGQASGRVAAGARLLR